MLSWLAQQGDTKCQIQIILQSILLATREIFFNTVYMQGARQDGEKTWCTFQSKLHIGSTYTVEQQQSLNPSFTHLLIQIKIVGRNSYSILLKIALEIKKLFSECLNLKFLLNWLAISRILCFQKLNYFQPNVLHILHHFFLAIVYLICDSFFFSLVTNLKCKGGKLAYIRLHRNLSDMVDRIWVQWNLVGKHIGLQENKRHQSIFSNRIPEKVQCFLPPPPINSFFPVHPWQKNNFS